MIETGHAPGGARALGRALALSKAVTWIAYGIVRVVMGFLGYGGEEWFPAGASRLAQSRRSRLQDGPARSRRRNAHADPDPDLRCLNASHSASPAASTCAH